MDRQSSQCQNHSSTPRITGTKVKEKLLEVELRGVVAELMASLRLGFRSISQVSHSSPESERNCRNEKFVAGVIADHEYQEYVGSPFLSVFVQEDHLYTICRYPSSSIPINIIVLTELCTSLIRSTLLRGTLFLLGLLTLLRSRRFDFLLLWFLLLLSLIDLYLNSFSF